MPEIVRIYDCVGTGAGCTSGAPACPVGTSCTNQKGRLAYVKARLMCTSSADADGDYTLEQETWYGYDAAGRVTHEYISDDVAPSPNNRTALHQYAWTKNGALAQTTLPSGSVLGATFGSAGSNSDTDRATALWRTTTATPIIDNILYQPYGPFRQYNQQNSVGGSALRTKVTRNLAYRITETRVETQSTSATQHSVLISEDAKGRVTGRDYTPNITGLVDSYFVYDTQDRVLCERSTPGTTCPSTFGGEKNNHTASPAFTAAGDWKTLWRPILGSTGWIHNFSLVAGTHQIYEVNQNNGSPTNGITRFTYDGRGNRSSDDNLNVANDLRTYTYDSRRNVVAVQGQYPASCPVNQGDPPCTWWNYTVSSASNRRVFKSYYRQSTGATATWFFYYDAASRLAEVRYTPNTSSPLTYTSFEFIWLSGQIVAYWQTDYPSVTVSKRYVARDELGRPVEMATWPGSGDTARLWSINPDAWGNDKVLMGSSTFQPVLFAGQYSDSETKAFTGGSAPKWHRPAISLNGFRSYDSWTGNYLQVDRIVQETWSPFTYVDSNPVGRVDPSGLLAINVAVSFGDYFWLSGEVGCWYSSDVEQVSACLDGFRDPFGFTDPKPRPRPHRPYCETHPSDPVCHDYSVECNVCETGCNIIFDLDYCIECQTLPAAEHAKCFKNLQDARLTCLFTCAFQCLEGGFIDLSPQVPNDCVEEESLMWSGGHSTMSVSRY